MPKREYILSKECDHPGCSKTSHTKYNSRKSYDDAFAQYKKSGYFCLHHSRKNVDENNPYVGIKKKYKISPEWSYDRYKGCWIDKDGNNKGYHIWGDDWSAMVDDLPLGTELTVETSASLTIPANPDPMPEWCRLIVYYDRHDVSQLKGHRPVLLDSDCLGCTDEGDFLIMLQNGAEVLIGKHVYGNNYENSLDRQAYRRPLKDERTCLRKMWNILGKGSRVKFYRLEPKDYHRYDWKKVYYSGTILEYTSWSQARILDVDGKEHDVFAAWIESESKNDG